MQPTHVYARNLENGLKIVLSGEIDPEDFSKSRLVVLCGPAGEPYNLKPIAGYTFNHGTRIRGECEQSAIAAALLPFYLDTEIPDLMHSLTRRLLADLGGYIKDKSKKKEIITLGNISTRFEFSDDQSDAGVSAFSGEEELFEYVAQRTDNCIIYKNKFNLENLLSLLKNASNNTAYSVQVRLMAQDLMNGLLPETQKDLETKVFEHQQEAIAKADEAYWSQQEKEEKEETEKSENEK